MRIYIIGNDGIALSREAPGALNEGEIVVASNEELHAAPLSGKQLLALWNALPGVEKRKKVGDRAALIDLLWRTIEALPDPEPQPDENRPSKQTMVIAMQPALRVVGEPVTPPRRQRNAERRPREYLTPAEVEMLIGVAKKRGRYGHPDATMILITYRHGLRVGELCTHLGPGGFRPGAVA